MMWPILLLLFGQALCFPLNKTRVDLSYIIDSNIPRFPSLKPFAMQIAHDSNEFNVWVQLEDFETTVHIGTHIDAPIHFSPTGMSVDQIPADRLSGPAVVVDVQEQVELNGNYAVTVQDMTTWEEQHGQIPDKSFVLIRTGLGRYWNDTRRYIGTDTGDAAELRYPGISRETAEWLVSERDILGVGLDSLSLDVAQERGFPAHVVIMGANLTAIENMANVDKLPNTGIYLELAPIKLRGAGGAPTQVTAYY